MCLCPNLINKRSFEPLCAWIQYLQPDYSAHNSMYGLSTDSTHHSIYGLITDSAHYSIYGLITDSTHYSIYGLTTNSIHYSIYWSSHRQHSPRVCGLTTRSTLLTTVYVVV